MLAMTILTFKKAMDICRHCIIKGKVQGVFFRHATYEKATALGLKGFVQNLQNGDVECLICGKEELVLELCRWLEKGPPAAVVRQVIVTDRPFQEFADFVIRR